MSAIVATNSRTSVQLADLLIEYRSGFASGDRADDGVIQVRMHNVDLDGRLDLAKATRVPATSAQREEFSLRPGDVLFNNTNSTELVGKSAIFVGHAEPVLFSNHFTRLRTNARKLEPRYLARWLTYQQQRRVFEGLCTRWVNQSAVRAEKLISLSIPLPPLAEQQRIADILDKADAIRRKRQHVLREVLELPRRLFFEMFGNVVLNDRGWCHKSVGEVGEVQLGRQRSPKYQSGKFTRPYIRVANVFDDRIDLSDVLTMDFDERDYAAYRLEYGDILLNEGQSTELVGRPAIWRNELPDCCFQNTLVRFRADDRETNAEFALAVFREYLHRGAFARISSKTSSVAHLGAARFAAMPFPLPPRKAQEQFAGVRKQLRETAATVQESYKMSDDLFGSLVDRAFRGEL